MGSESPKILIHICIGPKTQTDNDDMFKDKHAVSLRPIVVGEEDSINRNTPGNYAEDEPFLD